ncbi:MAG: DUF2442 domain-containing protein [Planctomycetota bacterium]|jgi:hypothetical protein|nr:DUF2442 domain-containing protein [Planctomycetota bacterium]
MKFHPHFSPKVWQAVPADDFAVYAYCNDGAVRRLEIKPLIKPDTVFAPLADINFFKEKLTVINDTVAWDLGGNRDPYKCLDLDPFKIFDAPTVADPLAEK